MRYFALGYHNTHPESHLWDIFIGDQPPDFSLLSEVQMEQFDRVHDLCRFLAAQRVDQISIFRSPGCSEELVEDLADWADLNLSLHNLVTFAGEGLDVLPPA